MGPQQTDVPSGPGVPIGAPGAAPGTTATTDDDKPNPAVEAFTRIRKDLDEIKEYAGYYLAAKMDGFRRSIRDLGLYAALGVVGLIVGGTILATAAGLIVVGLGQGLGVLFGGRFWLGYLVTGIVILALVGAGAYVMLKKLTGAWRSSTIKKYEQRKQIQRVRFGHDVADRAAANAAAAARAASGSK